MHKILNIKPNKILFYLIALIIFSFPTLSQFFHQGMYRCDDGSLHLAKMGAFYLSFREGHFVPRWGEYLANGYGLPTPLLNYIIPYYLQLPLLTLGLSLIDSFKLTTLFCSLAGYFIFYIFFKRKIGNFFAFVAVCFIAYSPYWIANIFGRCSLGEHAAFLGLSLALLVSDYFFERPTIYKFSALSLSFAFIALSQPMYLVIYAPLFMIYYFFLYKKNKNIRSLIFAFLSYLLGISLSSFNLLPIILELKYTYYSFRGWSGSNLERYFIPPINLFIPEWKIFFDTTSSAYPQFFGFAQIFIVIISVIVLFKKKVTKNFPYIIIGLITFIISLFLNLKVSLILYQRFSFLSRIQFPWRFIGLASLSFSFIYIGVIDYISKCSKVYSRIISINFIILLILTMYYQIGGRDYKPIYELGFCRHNQNQIIDKKGDNCFLYQSVNIPDYGLVSLPIWAKEPHLYPRVVDKLEILDGEGKITELTKKDTYKKYMVNFNKNSLLIFRTFYFPGWNAKLDGKLLSIQFQHPIYPGLILVTVPAGQHILEFSFDRTKTRFVSEVISIISFVFLFILVLFSIIKNIHKNR